MTPEDTSPVPITPAQAALVAAVRAHALAQYERDGWDYLVECWSDDDILEQIGRARTAKRAIAACRKTVKLLQEQQDEARAAGGCFD